MRRRTETLRDEPRDLDLAVEQIAECLLRQLGECAPDQHGCSLGMEDPPCALLTENNLLNAARHIAQCLDIYGRGTR